MSNAKTHDVKAHPSVAGHIPPAPGRIRRALRLVGWNALFLVAGLALIGVVSEMYCRLRAPFLESDAPYA